ncbi:methyltransferase domain-containing protein [Sphingomonas sp. 1P06PA]|uniref:methyltransferase domain-containing protein n=1 Tax=Sphingomonas sp. 1P06PA TaxID=554121 RepID=UPI0039A43B0F
MRPDEATWIREQLMAIGPDRVSPLLNFGSSTGQFRSVTKPHIDGNLFAPLAAAGVEVVHFDLKAADGVDISGDANDPAIIARLRAMGFRAILCSNLLEHVRDPGAVARSIVELVDPPAHIVVTGPLSYPYHPDPIDTMYRPQPAALAALFPNTRLVTSAVIADDTLVEEVRGKGRSLPVYLATALLRIAALWRPRIALAQAHRLTWLFRRFSVAAIVLSRE